MRKRKYGLRAVAVVAALGMATVGVLSTGAGAQSSGSDPGVTAKDVTLGYISSQTGVAASTHRNAHKACQGRVAVENAKGGVFVMLIERGCVTVAPAASVTRAEKLLRPILIGVPVMAPVA